MQNATRLEILLKLVQIFFLGWAENIKILASKRKSPKEESVKPIKNGIEKVSNNEESSEPDVSTVEDRYTEDKTTEMINNNEGQIEEKRSKKFRWATQRA
ncbi:unnamed protein product [Lepeophtheirus salmonis]|uniref:(salmon louse) hypothetical protein n=1 Tax=Lepeophtheirus salmonis TaxID=72036 RepID=A0A7R8GYV5_LEPSM|nr:unnamed protein product [Lepeophtheirus salmonis]CAF2754439.1 unnamed protein product [Lepeophtheirus salmonis]